MQEGTGKNLLLVAYHFPGENTSGAIRPGQFAKYLPAFGYNPYVISRRLTTDSLETMNNIRRVPDEADISARLERSSRRAKWVQRWLLPYNEQLPWAPYAVDAIAERRRSLDVPIIVSTSPPIVTHLAVLWTKLRNPGIRWIADLQDPLWGNPFRNRRMASYYDRSVEWMIFRHADALIANTEPVGELWRKRYPQWRHKIHVITNGFDPDDEIQPKPTSERSRRIIAHVGSIYGGRRPTVFLSAVLRLIERGALNSARLTIRLVGTVQEDCARTGEPPFSSLVQKGCLEYTGNMVPAIEAREAMLAADSLLLLDVNSSGAALQVPAKLYDYLRTGRPILAMTPANSPAQTILEKSQAWHRCVPAEASPDQVEACVHEFFSQAPPKTTANEWFYQTFSAAAKTRQLADILAGVEGKDSAK